MNATQLLTHFEAISEAPDAIALLRRFILDLAVRGKLVPQSPVDEPVSDLLKQIRAAKAQAGLRDAHTELRLSDVPFILPSGWTWTVIGEVCSKTGSGSTPRGGREVYKQAGIPFLRSQNVYDNGLRMEDVAYIDEATHARMAGTAVKAGDLLLNITGGSIGHCCCVPDSFSEANVSQHVAILRPSVSGMQSFLHTLIQSPYFQSFVVGEQTGAGRGGLPKNRMDRIAVALPPLAEQHRIVARVDELMGICDQLKVQRAKREDRRGRLATASLARLTTPSPGNFKDDTRFILDALPALTSRPEQIKLLRQTIMNLAVRGELVPQTSGNGPISVELERVRVRKLQKSLRRPKQIASISEAEKWCDLPKGWEWVRWDHITDWITYGFTKPMPHEAHGVPIITGKNVNYGHIVFETADRTPMNEFIALSDKDKPRSGDILITKDGSIGRTAIVEDHGDFCINQSVAVLWLRSCHFNRRFLKLVLDCPQTQLALLEKTAGVAIKHISIVDLGKMCFPLPPAAEQDRIVAKVDELLILCDQLEASLHKSDEAHHDLLTSILVDAIQPSEERDEAA